MTDHKPSEDQIGVLRYLSLLFLLCVMEMQAFRLNSGSETGGIV